MGREEYIESCRYYIYVQTKYDEGERERERGGRERLEGIVVVLVQRKAYLS